MPSFMVEKVANTIQKRNKFGFLKVDTKGWRLSKIS